MSNSPYTIRNYRPADFNKYVQLNIEAANLEPTGRCISPQVISESLGRPNYSLEQDLFIVEIAESIVGYMDVTPELKIRRVILNCFIHPDHKRKGLASKFLDYAMPRAKELGVNVAQINILQDNVVAESGLLKLGFKFVRRFLELGLDITKARWQDVDQTALPYRPLQSGEEDKLTQLQNRAFADTWGYNPSIVEEIVYRINSVDCSPEEIVLTYDGDEIIGYCWTRICQTATGEKKGQIHMLGVAPDYRGRGIGKGILLAGLSYIKNKGLPIVELTVDSENKAACALYRSVGFKVRTSSLWYEKVVD
ncbi:GNAT family N-acetyltransferase [Chloroflexota bacterium]